MARICTAALRCILVVASLAPFAETLFTQEIVNLASIGGRVIGRARRARDCDAGRDQRHARDRDRRRGPIPVPYLQVGPYQVTISKAGFSDAVQVLTLTAGAAFELPISLSVA